MSVSRSPEHLNDGLLAKLRESRLIGIHGANASGKSSLAREISQKINGVHIEVDDHLSTPANGRAYLQQVKFDEIKQAIQNADPPVIVDCFILMDVLEKLDMQPDLTLYCQRHMEGNFCFNPQMEREFQSYQERHRPEQYAYQIFTLKFSN